MRSIFGFGSPQKFGFCSSTVVCLRSSFVTMKGPVPMIGSFSSNFWIAAPFLLGASFHLCVGRIGM